MSTATSRAARQLLQDVALLLEKGAAGPWQSLQPQVRQSGLGALSSQPNFDQFIKGLPDTPYRGTIAAGLKDYFQPKYTPSPTPAASRPVAAAAGVAMPFLSDPATTGTRFTRLARPVADAIWPGRAASRAIHTAGDIAGAMTRPYLDPLGTSKGIAAGTLSRAFGSSPSQAISTAQGVAGNMMRPSFGTLQPGANFIRDTITDPSTPMNSAMRMGTRFMQGMAKPQMAPNLGGSAAQRASGMTPAPPQIMWM